MLNHSDLLLLRGQGASWQLQACEFDSQTGQYINASLRKTLYAKFPLQDQASTNHGGAV